MSKGRPEVYLDLDGVVADFFNKYAELAIINLMMEKYNKTKEEAFRIYHSNEELYQKEFGIRSYRDIPPAKGDPVLNMMIGTDFFNRLPKFGTADALVSYLVKIFGGYKVLSSPLRGDFENSEKYKKIWVAREFKSNPPSQVIIEHRKEKYAKQPDGTPNILIDDRGNNITNWEAKGGIGIKYQADEDSLDTIYKGVERAFKIIRGEEEHIPQVLKSKDRTKTIATGDDEKDQDADQVKESAEEIKANFVAIFTKFLPLAMKVLKIDSLPKMKFEVAIDDLDQPTFGRFDPDNNELTVALANRHPNDILRTVAHELVHYKQGLEHKLDDFSGETGSDEENEAHAVAGVIMRYFNKQYPQFLKQKPLMLGDLNERRKRRKRRRAAYGPGPYGWYGYNAGYSGDSGEGSSDGGSLEEAWSEKYKRSINCSNPKGFSQKAHCAGRKKRNEELEPKDVHKLADKKDVEWDMDANFMAKTQELTGKKHLDDLDQADLQKVVDWLRTLDEGDLIPLPKGTVKVDVSDVYDWYKLGMHISNLKGLGKHDFGKGPPQTVLAFGSEPEEHKYLKYLNQIGLKTHDIDENFADGKGPGRPGDSQRHGIPKKASLAQLDKIGKGSGRKAQLARWQANMRRGKKKK